MPAGKKHLVVIGNGMAGIRAVEEIMARAGDRFDITIYGAEPHGAYNRILLSPLLSGEKRLDEIVTHDHAWYDRHGITLLSGEKATVIDPAFRLVRGASGRTTPYDALLLATGSAPLRLDLPGSTLPEVLTFRDLGDVQAMRRIAAPGRRAVVIGGGLLGLEAAHGLAAHGMSVTVVHLMPSLMERQLDGGAAELLAGDLARRGISILTAATTQAILGRERVTGVLLADGRALAADLVVMAAGIRPEAELARATGLACGRGILVDDELRTSDPNVYAVGECVEHRGLCYGLVAPLWAMAEVAADRITGTADTRFTGAATATRLKVTGIDMFSAGDFSCGGDVEDLVFRDDASGVYKRLVVKDNRLRGAVLYGDAGDGGWYFDLLRDGTDIAAMRDTMIFGRALALAVDAPAADPA